MNNSGVTKKPLPGPLGPVQITALYILVGVLWIPLTDQLLVTWIGDVATLTLIQTLKGGVFVLVTAVLLYLLSQRSMTVLLQQEITDRTQAEAALRESEERFRQIAEHIHEVIWITDATTRRTLYVNPAYNAIWGCPPQDPAEQHYNWLASIHIEDRARIKAAFENMARSGEFNEAYRILRPDGTRRWLREHAFPVRNAAGEIYRYAGIIRDITERQQMEEVLRRSERELTDFFENAVVGLHWAGPDGTILRANQAELDLLGYTRDEYIDHHIAEFHVDPAVIADILSRLAQGETIREREARLRCKDGSIKQVLIAANVLWEHGQFIHSRCFTRDITQLKQAEEKLRQQRAELAHMARVSLASELASGLAHELNQPLAAITVYIQTGLHLLRSEQMQRASLQEALEKAAAQALRAAEIIRRLRRLVRREAPHRSAIDVNELIQEVVYLVEADACQQGVRIRLALTETLPSMFADAIQIQQVILNLVRNAMEAMSESQSGHRELTIQSAPAGNNALEVAVADTGPGLSAEARTQLFMPFFTTKAKGMGLGLSLSQSIIEAHSGRLWVTPNPDGGATFHFTLPYDLRTSPRLGTPCSDLPT